MSRWSSIHEAFILSLHLWLAQADERRGRLGVNKQRAQLGGSDCAEGSGGGDTGIVKEACGTDGWLEIGRGTVEVREGVVSTLTIAIDSP